MNNNFDELILKRRARGKARTASMGAHVSWGANGRGRTVAHGEGARACVGSPAAEGRPRQRGAPGRGAHTCTPSIGGAYGARMAASHVVRGGANVRALQWRRASLKWGGCKWGYLPHLKVPSLLLLAPCLAPAKCFAWDFGRLGDLALQT
jgi:hypothetical protein